MPVDSAAYLVNPTDLTISLFNGLSSVILPALFRIPQDLICSTKLHKTLFSYNSLSFTVLQSKEMVVDIYSSVSGGDQSRQVLTAYKHEPAKRN